MTMLEQIARRAESIALLAHKKAEISNNREQARARLECHSQLRELLEQVEEEI